MQRRPNAAGLSPRAAEPATRSTAVIGEFKTALGPELEHLADGLAPAITKLVERLTKTTVEQAPASFGSRPRV